MGRRSNYPMPLKRRAVIDVGTNSVKLLVADLVDGEVRPVWEGSAQTRLGSGLYQTRRLQPAAIAQTAAAVASFAGKAREMQAEALRVIATSAARDAVNPGELTAAIHATAGLSVEIISGDREAEWAFRGVTSDAALAKVPLLLLDVGGGSTEFILGREDHLYFRGSFELGTVRLMEAAPRGDPPAPRELAECRGRVRAFLAGQVRPKLDPILTDPAGPFCAPQGKALVGAGGTATILARLVAKLDGYDRARIESTRLSRDCVHRQVERLWGIPLAERRQLEGMVANRADVILTGVVIYEAVMEEFAFSELRVSTRGLRFAAVMQC